MRRRKYLLLYIANFNLKQTKRILIYGADVKVTVKVLSMNHDVIASYTVKDAPRDRKWFPMTSRQELLWGHSEGVRRGHYCLMQTDSRS